MSHDMRPAAPARHGLSASGEGGLDGSYLQEILEKIPGGFTLFDAELRMIACNAEFRRLLGMPDSLFADGLPSFEDLIRYNAARGEYGPIDIEDKVQAILEKARHPVPHIYERTRPDGMVLEIRGTPLPQGGFATIYIDITERKKVEEEATRYATYLRTVLDTLPQGVSVFDENLAMVLCNGGFRKVLDLPPEFAGPGVRFIDLLEHNAARGEYGDEDPEEHVRDRVRLALDFQPHRFQRTRPNGRQLDVQGTPMRSGDHVIGFVTTYTDITETRKQEEALRRANSLFQDAIAYSPTYIYEVDSDGRFTFIKGSEKVLGYSEAELLGRRFGELRCRDVSCREHRNTLDDAFRKRQAYEQVLTCAVHKDGTHLWLAASGNPIIDADGGFSGYRGVGFDVTETTNSRKELERMALMDPLTGLANRRKFLDRFKLEVERQERHSQPLSFLVVDVDHFKQVNDQFGHLTGDMCLKCVADLLALVVRKIDLVARFGGEEFIVLLPDTSGAGAVIVAEKLRTAVESLAIPIDSRFEPLHITVSVGVAVKQASQPLTFDDLMELADQGLYQAKRDGRNRVVGPREE